jgi:uncharacterized protein (TIGR01777 family)
MRIFVTGGSGSIGRRLIPRLLARGDQVVVLSRNAEQTRAKLGAQVDVVEGNPMHSGTWMQRVSGCDGVVSLIGEGIFKQRWSDTFKAALRDSRIASTQNLVAAIGSAAEKPRVLVNGSAVGFYGFQGDADLTEDSPPGDDFLAKLCVDWENAAKPVEALGVRLVFLRTGVVLDNEGGALAQMMLPFKLFVGGKAGSGKQWISWLHHADEVGIILLALDNAEARGPLNATAPAPVTNGQLAKALGAAMSRPSFFPTPGFMLKLALGERACLVLDSQRVLPRRAQQLGYRFQFTDVDAALREIFSGPAAGAA